jgi:hypothetical protein
VRRLPAPLLAVLCIAAVQALAWSVLLPAFQGQDEAPHFAYTQRLVETGKPTWSALETLPRSNSYSTEVSRALVLTGHGPLRLNLSMRPYAAQIDEDRWRAFATRLSGKDRADGTYTSSMRNPPLYYMYEGIAYAPLRNADLFTRLYAMRWLTIPFFLFAVLSAWLLAGEVFGRRRWLQATAALVVALQPMLAQLGGVVNPDAAIAALWGLGLWLAAVIVNRGVTGHRLVAAGAIAVGSVLVQARAAPVILALATALAVRGWRWTAGRRRERRLLVGAIAGGTLAVVAGGVWYALRGEVTVDRVREMASYIWQFYLPRPSFMEPTLVPEWGVGEVFVERVWSGMAQLDVYLAPGVLDAVSIATIASAVIVLATLVIRRDATRRRAGLLAVFVVALVGLMYSLHVAAWRDLPTGGDPIITGRYLTPLLPMLGVAVAAVAVSLPRRVGPAAATLVLGLEGLLALGALGAAVVRFYG